MKHLLFFCRHPRVHVASGVVDEPICRDCTYRDASFGGALRPVPSRLPKRTWVGLTDHSLEYISLERMSHDVRSFIGRLPSNLAAVAGIPRSGMLPAAIVSMLLHIPLYELSGGRLSINRAALT